MRGQIYTHKNFPQVHTAISQAKKNRTTKTPPSSKNNTIQVHYPGHNQWNQPRRPLLSAPNICPSHPYLYPAPQTDAHLPSFNMSGSIKQFRNKQVHWNASHAPSKYVNYYDKTRKYNYHHNYQETVPRYPKTYHGELSSIPKKKSKDSHIMWIFPSKLKYTTSAT